MRETADEVVTVSIFSFRYVFKSNHRARLDMIVGADRVPAQVRTPPSGAIFCAPHGDDQTGTGAEASPFQTVDAAVSVAQPGDTIYLRPGQYPPTDISRSGEAGARLVVTTLPGEERQAIIDGSGVAGNGMTIYGQEHIDILNLTFRNIISQSAVQIGGANNISVQGCQIYAVDRSAIICHGTNAVKYRDGPDTSIHMANILIKGNDCYDCYRLAAGNEVISIGAGVSNIIIEHNHIHDSLQYGIDLKVGVQDAIVRRNYIWGVKNHAIYLDCAKKFLRRIQVYDNWIWGPGAERVGNTGIVMAREAEGDAAQSELTDIDIYNNRIFGVRRNGIMAFAHGANGGDQPLGSISNVRIRFNTVYDCGKDSDREELRVADWHSGPYAASGVVSGFDVIGNVFWRPGGAKVNGKQAMARNPEFTYADNVETDPGFVDPDVVPAIPAGFLPEITLPDFSLRAGSAAIGAVSRVHVVSPFETDANGVFRSGGDAGALSYTT